ncbi:DAK2 domain-containing protein [Acidimicrobium ferrooxidans]|uniref:DAK2 domain-containing protein n=1 Tax=Acidimicrobium ferrooxidans TaxID=53635 RepID=UPI00019DE47A|nr:DAK2 domain-containing protein [Acidimicrobium ferrooxidans]
MAERQSACAQLTQAIEAAVAGLASVRDAVDRLNVFPVPDGDTGSNMLRTLEGMAEAARRGDTDDCAAFAGSVARGALLAARGNSGVILAQILGSLVRELASDPDRARGWMRGLEAASASARAAVLDPKPGTMLSVIDAAAGASDPAAAIDAARAAEERTPTQLAVLAAAGVVDSGGAGLVVVLEAMSAALGLTTSVGPYPWLDDIAVPVASVRDLSAAELVASDREDELRYEVMFSLEAPERQVDALRVVWAGLGDSIVIVGDGTVWRCHVHTNDIAAAIQGGIDAGRVRDLSVTDLREQTGEVAWVRDAPPAAEPSPPATAVVAVGTGSGIARLFRSFGVASIVAGGQGANPSIAELVDAVRSTHAKQVIVLPNNANILAAASAMIGLVDAEVAIVPTVHLVQGFAALMAYDPESGLSENERRMTEAARRVRWGEVTVAVRDGSWQGGVFGAGSAIGISDQGIVSVGPDPEAVLVGLCERLLEPGGEIVTVIVGERGHRERVEAALAGVFDRHHGVELEVIEGGQPLYPYLLGVE